MFGNLIQISITIHHIKMRCENDMLYSANFQIGSLESNQTAKTKLIDNLININQTIKLSCQKSSLIAQKNKIKVNVHSHSNINRRANNLSTIVGSVTLISNSQNQQQQQIVKKLQHCRVRNAQIKLSWKISSKQLNIIQHNVNSPTSQSSFSSLRQLHHFLTEKDNPEKIKLQKIRSFRRSVQKQDGKHLSCEKQNGSLNSPKMSQISPILQQNNNMTFNDFDWSFLKNADAHFENIVQLQEENQKLKRNLQMQKELNAEKQVKFQQNVRNFVATMSDLEKRIIQFQRKLMIKDQTIKALQHNIEQLKFQSSGQKKSLLTRKQLGEENKKRFSRKSSNQNSLRSSRVSRDSSTKSSKIIQRKRQPENSIESDFKKQKSRAYHFNIQQQLKMLQQGQFHAVSSTRFLRNEKKDKFSELQMLNEQLYFDIKNLKSSLNSYEEKLKSKEINEELLKTEIQELKSQLNMLKKQKNSKSTIVKCEPQKINQNLKNDLDYYMEAIQKIEQQNYQLKMKNKDYQKKYSQSLEILQQCRKEISAKNNRNPLKIKIQQFSFDKKILDEESDSGFKSDRKSKILFQKNLVGMLEKTITDRQKIMISLHNRHENQEKINYFQMLKKLKLRIHSFFLSALRKQFQPLEANVQIVRIIEQQFNNL